MPLTALIGCARFPRVWHPELVSKVADDKSNTAEGDFSGSTLLERKGDQLVPALSGPEYIFGVTRVR